MAVINYDVEKLKSAINDFYNATGVNINFLNEDFTSLTNHSSWTKGYCSMIQQNPKGKKRCFSSDRSVLEKCRLSKKAEVHICHAGLVDVAVPVVYNDNVIAYMILGQMKMDTDFASVKKYISDLELNFENLKDSYDNMPTYDEEKVRSVANIAVMLTKYIMLESILRPGMSTSMERVLAYISKHYETQLSVDNISKNTNVSKTSLYKYFRQNFACTVSEYINGYRVEKSLDLLVNSDLSIEIISQNVGFLSASYYTRVFKDKMGYTPLKYRKEYK